MADDRAYGCGGGGEAVPDGGSGVVVSLGDGWESDDGAGRRPEDEAVAGPVVTVSREAWARFVALASSERGL